MNQAHKDGRTPLHIAAAFGQTGCLKLLLADPRVDVDHKDKRGGTALFNAAMFFGTEATAVFDGSAAAGVGGAAGSGEEEQKAVGDPARCLVLMLQSGRVSRKHVKDTIAYLSEQVKINTQSGNHRLNAGNLLALPILEFELIPGEQRWCTNCLCVQTKADQESKKKRTQVKGGLPLGMDRCSGCKRAFYCCDECQLEHWEKGHKDECKRMAEERKKEEEEAEKEEEEGKEGGGAGGDTGGGGGGAGGGAGKKKKGKKKGKKRR